MILGIGQVLPAPVRHYGASASSGRCIGRVNTLEHYRHLRRNGDGRAALGVLCYARGGLRDGAGDGRGAVGGTVSPSRPSVKGGRAKASRLRFARCGRGVSGCTCERGVGALASAGFGVIATLLHLFFMML